MFFALQVYSFWNVCIEAVQKPVTHIKLYHGRKIYFNETAKIIVYNSSHRDGQQKLPVYWAHNALNVNYWHIHFRRGRIPSSHTFHNSTVFFVSQTCPANLHHFWADEFVPLYYIVSRVNRLYPGANNQILYRRPTYYPLMSGNDHSGCHNKTVYEDILRTLQINPFHDVFYQAPVNECYSSAVFGTSGRISDPRIVVSYVTTNILGKETVERIASGRFYVTFVQRGYRQIVNVAELHMAALDIGFRQVRTVKFERHSIKEQVRLS